MIYSLLGSVSSFENSWWGDAPHTTSISYSAKVCISFERLWWELSENVPGDPKSTPVWSTVKFKFCYLFIATCNHDVICFSRILESTFATDVAFPGYEDPLRRQPQENQPGLIFWCGWTITKWTTCCSLSLYPLVKYRVTPKKYSCLIKREINNKRGIFKMK